jgi:hypothetical protein
MKPDMSTSTVIHPRPNDYDSDRCHCDCNCKFAGCAIHTEGGFGHGFTGQPRMEHSHTMLVDVGRHSHPLNGEAKPSTTPHSHTFTVDVWP